MSHSSRYLIACCVAAAIPANGVLAQGAPAEVEEVVVTGSYIQRSEGFTPASPVDTISSAQYTSAAPKAPADFLNTLPYNMNASFQTGRATGGVTGAGQVNLRNLGAASTLVLMDSRRLAKDGVTSSFIDVNSVLPTIMIERIEILKDGASALYGSDAVGGVLNFLTRKKFDGFETQAQLNVREIGTTTDYRVGAIWGAQSEKGGVVAAIEYFHRDPYNYDSLGFVRETGRITPTNGWPGNFTVPNRLATGAASGSTTFGDPLCGQVYPSFTVGASVTRFAGTAAAQTLPSRCQMNLTTGNEAQSTEERYMSQINLRREFSDAVNFFGQINYTYLENELYDHSTGTVNATPAVVIPGYAPGNTFRARNATGQLLFAQASPVQLTYDKDGNGVNEFVPLRGPTGAVLLNLGVDGVAGTADDAVGGVPFWEDVSIVNANTRLWSLQCGLPSDLQSRENCRRTNGIASTNNNHIARLLGGFDGQISEKWHYETAFTFARNDEKNLGTGQRTSFLLPNLRAAINGFGGPGCNVSSIDPLTAGNPRPGTGSCKFFNIFGNAVTANAGSPLANELATILYINPELHDSYRTQSKIVDAVISGALWDLPAGPLGVAFGVQHRSEGWRVDYDQAFNNGITDTGITFFDNDISQSINAAFAELSVPVFKNESIGELELSGAVRHENTAGPGLRSTDPKLGVLYSTPSKFVQLRGTWSTSFLAPSLVQRYTRSGAFQNGIDDGVTTVNDNLARVPVSVTGNPNLEPQESTAWNVGITFAPFDSLSIELDRWNFDFKGLISAESAVTIARDQARDPAKVVRDTSVPLIDPTTGVNIGTIVRINQSFFNAAKVATGGFDFAINHRLEVGRFGVIRNSIMATYVDKYDIQATATGPVLDGSDNRNSTRAGAALSIDLRATLRTTWSFGDNNVQSLVRYTDDFTNDNATLPLKPIIPTYTVWDLNYTRDLKAGSLGLQAASLTLGINNVLERNPPVIPDGSGTFSSVYDYTGRYFWARVMARF